MKNKANLKPNKFTANPGSRGTYNVSRPKTQNGTKPNEANLKPISKWKIPRFSGETQTKNFFMESKANFRRSRRSLGEDGLARRPVGVVLSTKKAPSQRLGAINIWIKLPDFTCQMLHQKLLSTAKNLLLLRSRMLLLLLPVCPFRNLF